MIIGIIGASGFIGRHLYSFLKTNGRDVIGTYCFSFTPGLLKFDLTGNDFFLLDKCDCVIILGAISKLDECFLNPQKTYQVNVAGSIRLIEYLNKRKIKIVFVSSDQVFDGLLGDYKEEDRVNPINCYGKQKKEVEDFILGTINKGLILRISKTYSRFEHEDTMFSQTVKDLRQGKEIRAAHNQIFNPTDVSLVCQGIIQALDQDLSGLYHLADKYKMSRYDFCLKICKELGFKEKLIKPVDINQIGLREKRPNNTSLNVEKIRKVLGWNG